MTTNQAEFDRAQRVLVGGVNSAVRAFKAVGGTPRFIARAQDAHMWDVEGNRYIDYVGSWGPAIVGHANSAVLERVKDAADRALSFGAPNLMETELAERIAELYSHVDQVRFTSSGTESAMSALRLARGYTGRTKIIKFEGCYHGTADSLLVKAGSAALAFGTPSSAGVPADLAKHTLVAQFNDLATVKTLLEANPGEVACVMVEPIPGNMNLIMPAEGFLAGLRQLCSEHGALLVFDEVMSGFRVALGGAQEVTGVTPDLSAFGKVIGGGMPVGAIGGPAQIMQRLSPMGDVYQAGTLSGNPIAMAAGLASLELISRPGFFDALHAQFGKLIDGLVQAARRSGVPFCAQHQGGMGGMYMRDTPPASFADATNTDIEFFKRFFQEMLARGVYLPPSPFEAFFFSSAHTDEDIEQTIAAAEASFQAAAA
ncbi:MAG: glutamate-1-semialdehyde 2,1-aminomutase [Burkholderiaceae bacterium]